MDSVYIVCKIPIELKNVDDAKIVREFSDQQIITWSILLNHNLTKIPMELFGKTFKQFSHNLRLVKVLDTTKKWEIYWTETIHFLDTIYFNCEHQDDEIVAFRITNTLGEMWEIDDLFTEFRVYVQRLMLDYFLPALNKQIPKNMSGNFDGGTGWLQFDINWIRKEFKVTDDIVSHQINTFHELLVKFNEDTGTHWKCSQFSIGPRIKNMARVINSPKRKL